ncbi:unnamed protein product [Arctogadus glacialis]
MEKAEPEEAEPEEEEAAVSRGSFSQRRRGEQPGPGPVCRPGSGLGRTLLLCDCDGAWWFFFLTGATVVMHDELPYVVVDCNVNFYSSFIPLPLRAQRTPQCTIGLLSSLPL